MIDYQRVRLIAENHLHSYYPSDCIILSEKYIDDPYGWYFIANIDTDNLLELYLGDGGFFIDGHTGEILQFGSLSVAIPGLDWWLEAYRMGFRPGIYNLVIQEVMNLVKTIEILDEHLSHKTFSELFPSFDSHQPWQAQTQVYIEHLHQLPFTCTHLEPEEIVEIIRSFESSNCCKYRYEVVQSTSHA